MVGDPQSVHVSMNKYVFTIKLYIHIKEYTLQFKSNNK
jgi:hypothetical protein